MRKLRIRLKRRRPLHSLWLVLMMMAITQVPAARTISAAAEVRDPLAPGPYAVGVTTTVFIDETRTDALTKEPRTLVTEIWYPATDEARNLPKTKFTDFLPGGLTPQMDALLKTAYRISATEIDRQFSTSAVRDAAVRKGQYPLVIFSHGNRGLRFQNTFWCDYLASHGYIVVSADHTGNAGVTVIKGKLVFFQASGREQSAQDRPKDFSFLLDQMTRWQNGGDSRFAGKLDLRKVTAAGMSFGSYTAIRAADLDPRFKAVIGMAYGIPELHTNLTVPQLLMLGEEDQTINKKGNEAIREQHAKHRGPSFLLEIKRGGHYSFTDMFKISPNFGDGVGTGKLRETGETFTFTPMEPTYQMINSYSIAFLGYFVRDERDYLPFLTKNRWPVEMNWQYSGIDNHQMSGK